MDKALQLRVIAALQDKLSGPLRKIKGGAGASAQGVSDLRTKLKQLGAAQRDIGQFRELSRGLQSTKTEMAAAQQRVATLSQQMQVTAAPTRAMTREFNQAVQAARQLKERHGQQSTELQRLRENLNRSGVSTANLARDEQRLRQRVDQTSQALAQQTRKLQAAAVHQQKLTAVKDKYNAGRSATGAMAGFGAGGLVVGGGALYAEAKFIAPGIKFDSAMSKVQALARLDKTSDQMAALRKQALDLGASTMFSATQAADAQGFLAMAGFQAQSIIDAMPGMLSLAKAGDTDLAQTADIGSNILTGFNLPAAQMGRVGDVLTAAFTRSNTSLYMLGETMKYVAPVAAGVGQDIETVAAMAGKLGDAGIQGSMGGTALRAVIGRLAAPPKAAADALKELKIRTTDAKGNLRDLPTILEELHKKTLKMGSAQRAGYFKDIAGEEAFSGLQVLVGQAGSGELQKFIATLRASAGEADKTAGTMADNMIGDLDELSSAWEDVGIHIQSIHDGPLRSLTRGLADVVGGLKKWMVENPRMAQALTAAAAGLAVLVAAFGALTLMLASMLGPFVIVRFGLSMLGIKAGSLMGILVNLAKGGFGLVGSAISFVGRLLLANPIALAVIGIAAAAYLIYQNWGAIKQFFSDLWNTVSTTFSDTMQRLRGYLSALDPIAILSTAWNAVAGFFGQVWDSVSGAVTSGIANVTGMLTSWSPLDALNQVLTGALSALGLTMPSSFTEFGTMLIQGLIGGITSMAGAVRESISNIGSGIIGWFKEKLGIHSPSRVFAEMGGFVSEGAAVGITSEQPAAVKAAQALAASVAIAGAMTPASGAPAASGAFLEPSALVGDQAGFLSRIDTRPPLAGVGAAGAGRTVHIAGDTITIHINGAGGSASDIGRAVEDALRRRDAERAARARSAFYDQE